MPAFDMVATVLVNAFSFAYSFLDNYLVSPFLAFTRGFEFALIFTAAALFFAISVFLLLRQAKKLPSSYFVEITDAFGGKTEIDGVRQDFSTHDAAESYARMYRDAFGSQYRFKVVGVKAKQQKGHRVSSKS